ncbi:MAG TPA: type VI secretion system protein TssA, partial [Gemmatimonadaceae bacterium]|nr:type VI secretion system protein TssA [Gemmatimonadaceae bacterium]
QGDWQVARKTADWQQVIKLAGDVLANKSKDLQIAAWLTEASLRKDGYGGLRDGLALLRQLVEQFWDGLYPELEDGDAELRAAPLQWVGLRLELPAKQVPLNRAGHTLLQYRESRMIPTEGEAAEDEGKQATRARAAADGKLLPEEFDKSFDGTPKPWYRALAADVESALAELKALDEAGAAKFGDLAPSYARLRGALEEVQQAVRQLLKRKLEQDPDPIVAPPADAGATAPADAMAAAPAVSGAAGGGAIAAEPVSRDDAAARVLAAARFLRRSEPRNPASYLMLRGFRWGELRATGSTPDPKLLEAPPTHVRTQLKGLLLDKKWPELLELAETVMGTPQGRGWLDLQRYALTACDGLGSDLHFVAAAVRAELRALLVDMPVLLDMTMMDDTPTANAETRAWLRDSVLRGGASPGGGDAGDAAAGDGGGASRLAGALSAAGDDGDRFRSSDAYERAMAEVRSGRTQRAIELLMHELAREKSRRGRFLRQTQIAGVMVDAGLHAVALPMLEELIGQLDAFKLEDWETGDVVARPLALLYRCLTSVEGDPAVRQTLYLRICRLDPLAAIGFAQQ